ncbi:amino acid ABC transporter substrate-binding protein, partial [Campylobacter jejuni]|nr:amino acid ABC transporter substrate-binding protein [Campylobacter jejuni]
GFLDFLGNKYLKDIKEVFKQNNITFFL